MDKKILDNLNEISMVFEDLGMDKQADIVNEIFLKVAKKKAKKKNVPTNPSLWSECKAWAKRTFDVYPCVPLDSMALTKKGWAEYSDLNIGDEILTYNQKIDKLEWKPIIDLHFYEDAPTLSLKKLQTNFKVRCTPDHKWVLKTYNSKYPDSLVQAKNITKRMSLKTAAEIVDDVNENLNLSNWRKGDDWVENVLKMSKTQLEAFFAAGIVYDGNDKGLSSLNRSTYGFSQKNINHGEAMEIAAVLLGYRVSFVQKMHNMEMKSWTFIKRDSESTGNLIIEEDLNCDVWCPQTENNTWVMKQGRIITITGNSAYANGAAAKRYKSKGGGWKKASSDSNMRLAQEVTETPITSFNLPGGESDQAFEKNPQSIYQQAINQIKNLIVSNKRKDANDVFSYYFNGTDLSPAQKTALQNQYNSILDRFTSKDKDFNLSNPMAQQYLLEEDTKANTYVANFIKRLGIPKAQITNNSKAFSDISKLISTIKDINIRYKAIDVLKGIVNMNSQTSRVKP